MGGRIPTLAMLAALVAYWALVAAGAVVVPLSVAVFVLAGVLAYREAKLRRDPLNPFTLILGLCAIRLGLPSLFLIFPGFRPPSDTPIEVFEISRHELLQGEQLAALGLVALVVGWYCCPRRLVTWATRLYSASARTMKDEPRLVSAAVVGFAVGCLAVVVYLIVNFGNPLSAAASGVARTHGTAGTGKYSFLAVGLITTSAVVLVLRQAWRETHTWPRVLAPAALATVILTILGGRVVALTPLALSALGAYYLRYRRRRHPAPARLPAKWRKPAAVCAVVLVGLAYFAFVPQYRGGGGIGALPRTLAPANLADYTQFSLWTELGAVHPYALSYRVGEGSLDGDTYPQVLGLAGTIAGVHGDQAGVEIAKRTQPGNRTGWGFQTGLVIDVFLNSGLAAATLAALALGILMRAGYEGYRRSGPTFAGTLLHALLLWTFVWVYFESIVALPGTLQITLPALAFIWLAARYLPDMELSPRIPLRAGSVRRRRRDSGSPARRPLPRARS